MRACIYICRRDSAQDRAARVSLQGPAGARTLVRGHHRAGMHVHMCISTYIYLYTCALVCTRTSPRWSCPPSYMYVCMCVYIYAGAGTHLLCAFRWHVCNLNLHLHPIHRGAARRAMHVHVSLTRAHLRTYVHTRHTRAHIYIHAPRRAIYIDIHIHMHIRCTHTHM